MAIMVSDLGTAFPRTGPIATGMIALFPREIGGAVGFRAGQNIVHDRLIAAAFNAFAIFVKRRSLDQIGAQVKLIQVNGYQFADGVIPRARTDPVTRRFSAFDLFPVGRGAELGPPRTPLRASSRRQFRALGISPGKTAKISTIADTGAGDEKSHWLFCRGAKRCAHQNECAGQYCRFHEGHVRTLPWSNADRFDLQTLP